MTRLQAAPHVTGIAVRCYAAGECAAEGDTEAERLAGFARAGVEAAPGFGFSGDPLSSPSAAQYYGYALSAARW